MTGVVAELRVSASDFELGRFFAPAERRVELETMVPVGQQYVPYVWVADGDGRADPTVETADSALVEEFRLVDSFGDRSLYTLRYAGRDDSLLALVEAHEAQLLEAVGREGTWEMQLRFGSHRALSSFRAACEDREVTLDVHRIYEPSPPDRGGHFGLTDQQREALVLATEAGYYDIPRDVSTVELAERLGVSDQAVTERLRRGIRTFVEGALVGRPDD